MQELAHSDKYVMLAGDFNARTGTDIEIFRVDNEKNDQFCEIFETMEDENFLIDDVLERNNEDKIQNSYGKLLLEMCKLNKLLIVNGRIGDNSLGEVTCKGSSTVDYFLCDYFIHKYIMNMQVLEQNKLFSDVHKPIALYLKLQKSDFSMNCSNTTECVEKIKPWDPSREHVTPAC